jgi:hypothetical protein
VHVVAIGVVALDDLLEHGHVVVQTIFQQHLTEDLGKVNRWQ